MRKTLLSLFALVLTLGASAQKATPFSGHLDRSLEAAQQRVVTLAPKKVDLQDNQRLVGYYTTDELAQYGSGLVSFGANDNCKAAIDLTPDMLEPYDGMKVVAIRFGLCYALDKSRVFITPITNQGLGNDVVSVDVPSTVKGWNTVKLTTPYVISKNQEFFVGFDFAQKVIPNGKYYTDECYPLSIVESGRTDMPILMFANISEANGGQGEGWYSFGTGQGNLSIQLVVEGNFPDYNVIPSNFDQVSALVDTDVELSVDFFNNSKEAVSQLDYVVSVDGVATDEQHANLEEAVATGDNGSFSAIVPGIAKVGKHNVTVEVTKVNGHDNLATNKVAAGIVAVAKTTYPSNVLIEEFTSEGCGNCPRVAGFLHTALSTADQSRVYAACHHAGYQTDWLTAKWDYITGVAFGNSGGSFNPAMMFNRNEAWVVGNANKAGLVGIPASAAVITATTRAAMAQPANAQLAIQVVPNEDGSKATVTVSGVCNEAYDTDNSLMTFYLTEDSVKPRRQSGAVGSFRHMHVIRANNSAWGEQVQWKGNTFTTTFDVNIKAAWKKKDLKFIAFLNKHNESKYTDNKVENVIGVTYNDAVTGIHGVYNDAENATVVGYYTIDGMRLNAPQKGLNIVKMSNGTSRKMLIRK